MSDKPFQENNKYTQIHNYTFDLLMPVLTGTGFKVLCFIIRNTKGVTDNEGNRVKVAPLSYSLIKEGTGIASSATLSEGIKELVLFGVITVVEGQEEYEANSYSINDNHTALKAWRLREIAKQYKQERKARSTKTEPCSEIEPYGSSEIEQPPCSEIEHIKRKNTTKEKKEKKSVATATPKTSTPTNPNIPYGIYERLEGLQRGINKGQTLKEVKGLLESGFTPIEIVDCAKWIMQEDWHKRGNPLSPIEITRKIDNWKSQHQPNNPNRVHRTGAITPFGIG